MYALVLDQTLRFQDCPKPVPGNSDALIKLRMGGICNTDLELVKGYMGFSGILGHEFVGEIADGPGTGERVVGAINIGCGHCQDCRRDLERHCPNRTVLGIFKKDGAFAEYFTLPRKNLYPVPASVADEQAVFAEPLAAALEILEQVQVESGARVGVVGDGKLGYLIAQVLRLHAADIRIIGRHESKLALFTELGIPVIREPDKHLHSFDIVVECSGKQSGMHTALKLVKPRGTLVLKSTYHDHLEMDAAALVINEITLVGSRCGQMEPAIRLLERGGVELNPLVDVTFPLREGMAAFEKAGQPESLKILLSNV